MTDFEFIITQCQKDKVDFWNDDVLKECIHKIGLLSDKERKNLLFEREVYYLGAKCPFNPNFDDCDEKICNYQDKLKDAIIESIPSRELIEILHGTEKDGIDFDVMRVACEGARGELRKRYQMGLDRTMIANAFSHTSERDKQWLKFEKKRQKESEQRYQTPFLNKLKDVELFIWEDEDIIFGVDNIISIKGCRSFWDEDGKRLRVIISILDDLCGVVVNYISIEKDIVLGVASDLYEYQRDNVIDSDKFDEFVNRVYPRNLVLGCMVIEKFIHAVEPKASPKIRCHDEDFLYGRFVIEACDYDRIFKTGDILEHTHELSTDEEKRINSFLDLVKLLYRGGLPKDLVI